jgi:predicted TIM-barrel fold metal-dependent hydrolase
LRKEPVLEPELPIVDAHHHLWDRQTGRYLADEFRHDVASGHRVVSTVYVQCRSMLREDGPEAMKPVGEVEFANGVAAMFASGAYGRTRCCEAIVGGADLTLGAELDAVLEAMLQVSGGRLRGIRNPLAWHASPEVSSSPVTPPRDLMANPAYGQGVRALGRFGLSLDAWVYHTQLDDLYELARAADHVTVVIDHFGGPLGVGPHAGRRAAVHAEWQQKLARLASLPNTRIKLGGAGMNVFGFDFAAREVPPSSGELASAWRPYFDTCVELFGVNRCMFESNFPVDKGMFSYGVLWNAFKRLASAMSANEKAALFSGTAAATYRLAIAGDNT